MPVVYPFIVNNPGEAAQAKRRIGAVTIGHMTPPLIDAGAHGAAHELEGLFDEFSQAQALDPRRAGAIADLILERAGEAGLLRECEAARGDAGGRAAEARRLVVRVEGHAHRRRDACVWKSPSPACGRG